ncbi:penicillin-binding protein 2A [Paenibacillus phyllosphaerae]|uniref:Penicillin-binding protein 2A n=1 Tax=Paenibacillus phyllosphaerae TaxID=274593 RepID=A0A7W5B385_9BACL|nr:PBP1A family penicillin-binding protein [Paenibacillus phyllosphaerae]MBB3113513.1 penicillin-binding protein 2A [Paenibacillus phyllosphaerae]
MTNKPNTRFFTRRLLGRVALLTVALFLLAGTIGWVALRSLVAAQDVSVLDEPLPEATIIYDRYGQVASRISLNKVEPVEYEVLPEHLIQAVVAVEDKRFFEHKGMDLRSISRAFFKNMTAGDTVEGGSTITQQLAKNVFLEHERTWQRKWNEMLLAQKIESHFEKEQILELYLNVIYFGDGAWGIKRAADVYFDKQVQELTVAESALLAGLIKAPSALNPFEHPEEAKQRRTVVLELMKEQGIIDSETYAAAIMEPIKLRSDKSNRVTDIKYPYFVDQVIREAMDSYGLTEEEVLHGGLHIYTTLDPKAQQAVEAVYDNAALFPESKNDQLIQSAAVLVDPQDGGIRALIGGRGDQSFRSLNRATQLKRQPGSTFKPIAVYTPALEKGYQPNHIIVDEPIDIDGYSPKNASGTYHGQVTLYEALIQSYNIPAVKTLHELGIDAGLQAAEKFGIPLTAEDRALGLALGGLHEGVSPLQMAEAFGAYANKGVRIPAHTIKRITGAEETELASWQADEGIQATTPDVAATMTAMLKGVVESGTGKAAAVAGREIAGKTGTTEMPGTNGDGARDNWFVGYTPQLVGAVWIGYDRSDTSHYLTTTSKAAASVFQSVMSQALKDEPVMTFPTVAGVPPVIVKPAESPGNGGKKSDDSWWDEDNDSDEDDDRGNKEEREAIKREEKRVKEMLKELEKRWNKGNGKGKGHDEDND